MPRSLDDIWGSSAITAPTTLIEPIKSGDAAPTKKSLSDIWGEPAVETPPVETLRPEISPIDESRFQMPQDTAPPEQTAVETDPLLGEKYRAVAESESPLTAGAKEAALAATYSKSPVSQYRKEEHPVASTVGEVAGIVAPALAGGSGTINTMLKVPKLAQLAASGRVGKIAFNALARMATGVIDYLARNNEELFSSDEETRGKARKNLAINIAAQAASPLPETVLPSNWVQPFAQAATGLIVETVGQAWAGDNAFSEENLVNTVSSALLDAALGVGDVKGVNTAAKRIIGKIRGVGGKTKGPEITPKPEVLNGVQRKTSAEAEIAKPEIPATQAEVPPEVARPTGLEERIGEELKNIDPIAEKLSEVKKQPSPLTMGGLSADQELPKYAKSINLERINADYGPKRVILESSADYSGTIDEARRGVITHEETRKLADDIGMTEKQLLSRKKGEAFNAEQILASRDLLNSSANRVYEIEQSLMAKRKEGTITDQDLIDLNLEMTKHAAILAEVSGVSTEAGRALGAMRILSEAKKKAGSVEDLLNIAGGREVTLEILDKLSAIDPSNKKALNKFIEKSWFAKNTDRVYEAWINAILSAPTTHIVNVVSNTATSIYRTLMEKPLAAAIDIPASKIQKRPIERFFGEMPSEIYGFGKGLPEAWAAFKASWKDGVPVGEAKVEQASQRNAIPGKAGVVIRTPTRLLSAADEFFKTIVYRGDMQSSAYRMAKLQGLKGAKLEAKANEILSNPSKKMTDSAKQEAAYRTFTNPLGKLGKSLMQLRRDAPGLKYIIPFIKTPTNIAKFALERMPGASQAILLSRLKKGEIKDAQISDEMAKGVAGSALAALTVMLAKSGMITGGGPQDKKERDALYRSGWLPYAFKIGDRYYSYSRMEPIASIIGTAADFATLDIDNLDSEHLSDIATKLSYSFGKNIISKTFMQGLSEAIDVMSDPERNLKRFVNQRAGSIVPNIIASTARATDEELKQIETLGETLRSRIPGLSHKLFSRRDIWGNRIIKSATGLEALLSPVTVSVAAKDPLNSELLRVEAYPSLPDDSFTYKEQKVKADPKIYDEFVSVTGKEARSRVEKLVRSHRYQRSSNEDKKDMILSTYDRVKKEYRPYFLRMQLKKVLK